MSLDPRPARSRYHSRVAVLSADGVHLRYIPGPLAAALVEQGTLTAGGSRGKIASVSIVQSAQLYAQRIGEPEGRMTGTRFYRWVHLEGSTSRIIEHHPRCMY